MKRLKKIFLESRILGEEWNRQRVKYLNIIKCNCQKAEEVTMEGVSLVGFGDALSFPKIVIDNDYEIRGKIF